LFLSSFIDSINEVMRQLVFKQQISSKISAISEKYLLFTKNENFFKHKEI
tara:strand:+ start:2619 stop:2768 length:150 start_codon:yes stop_codon:yes gene_type:complete